MSYVRNTIVIARPLAAVFDMATTGEHWPAWHPATKAVSGAVDHSIQMGEQLTEEARIAGRDGSAIWTCGERAPPHKLALEATGNSGRATFRLAYTFEPVEAGTQMTRELTYQIEGLRRNEHLTVGRAMREQSGQAMENLKAFLEAHIPAEPA